MLPLTSRRGAPAVPPVEAKRWAVLAIYNWIGFSQGMVWVSYSASATEARDLFSAAEMDKAAVNLLLNWGPIMYLVGIWPVMWILNRGGRSVYQCMLLASWLTAAGSVVRCVPAFFPSLRGGLFGRPIFWAHLGQILNGLSGPAVGGSCSVSVEKKPGDSIEN
jgi:hypothetical protein